MEKCRKIFGTAPVCCEPYMLVSRECNQRDRRRVCEVYAIRQMRHFSESSTATDSA
jgi:hypothetical protein